MRKEEANSSYTNDNCFCYKKKKKDAFCEVVGMCGPVLLQRYRLYLASIRTEAAVTSDFVFCLFSKTVVMTCFNLSEQQSLRQLLNKIFGKWLPRCGIIVHRQEYQLG